MGTFIVLTFFFIILPLRMLVAGGQWVSEHFRLPKGWTTRWQSLQVRRKKFWIYTVFGTLSVVLVQLLSPRLGFLHSTTEGMGFDLLNKIEYAEWPQRLFGVDRASSHTAGTSYAVVVVDDAAQEQWNNPAKVPRDKLQSLLAASLANKPQLIVLDIDLSFDGSDPNNAGLFEFLDHHARTSSIPLILMRHHRLRDESGRSYREEIATPFDDVYSEGAVWWASPELPVGRDKIVRKFLISTVTCKRDELGQRQPELTPGITLLVDMLLLSSPEQWPILRSSLSQAVSLEEKDCFTHNYRWQTDDQGQARFLNFEGKQWSLETLRTDNRTVFTLSPGKEGGGKLGVSVPALDLLNHAPLDTSLLRNRVLIVGTSHLNSNDTHRTSVGEMQGLFIILNNIETLRAFGQIKSLEVMEFMLTTLLVVLLFSWMASRYSAVAGMLISSAAAVVVLLLLSLWLYPKGIWFNFGVPLIAIQGNQLVGEFTQALMTKKGNRA